MKWTRVRRSYYYGFVITRDGQLLQVDSNVDYDVEELRLVRPLAPPEDGEGDKS